MYGNTLTVPVMTDDMHIHTNFCCTVTAVPNVPFNSRYSKMISLLYSKYYLCQLSDLSSYS